MNKSIDRIVTALAGVVLTVGVIKGPQIYSEIIKPLPTLSGVVTDIEEYETKFGFGTRTGGPYTEYTIRKDNGEEIFAANRRIALVQQGDRIEFRLGGSIGSWPRESYETKEDGTRVPVTVYPKKLKDVKPVPKFIE